MARGLGNDRDRITQPTRSEWDRHLVASHIAQNIEYTLKDGLEAYEIEAIFPAKQKFPQKELLQGSNVSLYDQVQSIRTWSGGSLKIV